jgi:mRNA interferase RelE/StbE
MKIEYGKSALKFLAKTDSAYVHNIRKAIYDLTKNPPEGDIKPMAGYKDGRKRLRYGKYRVIFRYDHAIRDKEMVDILTIINIGSRGDIYKED